MAESRNSLADQVRRVFHAYETADRSEVEPLLTDDFTFTSPYDDHITRATYFERCWPSAGTFERFQLHQIAIDGDVALVVYTGRRKKGFGFHNTERWQFTGDKLSAVEVFFGLPPGARPELPPDQALHKLLDERALAIRTKDAAAMVAMYARDAVGFELAPPLRNDAAQLRDPDGLARWFAGWRGPIETELRDVKITVRGELGFATALERLVATSVSGERTDLWTRVTYGFCQEAGAWKIAHVHQSVPFAMDGSFRALTDLAPPRSARSS